jgi:hypothetical protein
MFNPQRTNFLQNKMDTFTASLGFLFVIVLVIYENLPFVKISVLSNDIIRKFLLIEYELYYKGKIINIFRFVFLLKNTLKNYSNKRRKPVYLCSSTLLMARLEILESVTENLGTSRDLIRKAQKNTQSSGESLSQEVIHLTDAKVRSLRLAYSDFYELARQERAITTNPSTINSYGGDADTMFMSALGVIRATVAEVSNVTS